MTEPAVRRPVETPADTDGHVDLHLHSTASDGTTSPAAVVRRAVKAGLRGISLTDHDTVDGTSEAAREAERLDLDFLIGAELSANEPGMSVHLLAYGFDLADAALLRFFDEYRIDRERRARQMIDRLRRLGLPVSYADVERETGEAAPTRAHVARALVFTGAVATEQEVFRRYLSRGLAAFVEKRPTPPGEVIELVHAAGGVVLLAHPGRTHGTDRVRRWVRDGLDGVEVLHANNSPEVRRRMSCLAAELGLLRAGGSDWHGPGTRRSDLGGQRVPRSWMREISSRCSAA